MDSRTSTYNQYKEFVNPPKSSIASGLWRIEGQKLIVPERRLSDHVPLTKPVVLGDKDTLKIVLTATENGKPKRPHQAFLLLRDQDTGLEEAFPFTVKESGKGKVDFVRTSV